MVPCGTRAEATSHRGGIQHCRHNENRVVSEKTSRLLEDISLQLKFTSR